MAILKDVPPNTPKWTFNVFAAGLFTLAVSLLGVLLSLMASRKSMRYELQCVDGKQRSRRVKRLAVAGVAPRRRSAADPVHPALENPLVVDRLNLARSSHQHILII
jgi:hypothetical protein